MPTLAAYSFEDCNAGGFGVQCGLKADKIPSAPPVITSVHVTHVTHTEDDDLDGQTRGGARWQAAATGVRIAWGSANSKIPFTMS
jgi:hypothetical protein